MGEFEKSHIIFSESLGRDHRNKISSFRMRRFGFRLAAAVEIHGQMQPDPSL